jgi:hypothetical protein
MVVVCLCEGTDYTLNCGGGGYQSAKPVAGAGSCKSTVDGGAGDASLDAARTD